jgi:hypothetical protein
MMILFKDASGASMILNTDQLLYIGQACDQAKRPVLGQSVCVFVGGAACVLKGTPEELYGQLRKREIPESNWMANGLPLPSPPAGLK